VPNEDVVVAVIVLLAGLCVCAASPGCGLCPTLSTKRPAVDTPIMALGIPLGIPLVGIGIRWDVVVTE
jgi:hypothetical protein